MTILHLLACVYYDSGDTKGVAVDGDLAFGAVPSGSTASRGLLVDASSPVVTGADAGITARVVDGGGQALVLVTCDPDALVDTSGTLTVAGEAMDWTCERADAGPAPLMEIALAPLASLPANGLGDGGIVGGEGAALFASSRNGDLFLTDPDAGRVWRQDSFYVVPSWGVWTYPDMEVDTTKDWNPAPDCFEDGKPNRQEGECTGEETNSDGSVPADWRYYHGGFLGGDGTLDGVRTGADVPGPEVLVLAGDRDGAGWLAVVDASLLELLPDEYPYSYLELLRPVTGSALPPGLVVGATGDAAVALDPISGAVYRVSGLESTTPMVTADGTLGAAAAPSTTDEAGLVAWSAGALYRVGASTSRIDTPTSWAPLLATAPSALASDGARVWAAWPDGTVAWMAYDGSDAGFQDVPGVGGVVADSLGIAYLGVGAEVRVADGAAVQKVGQALAATPIAIGGDSLPHDVYAVYGAGSEGCDGPLASVCTAGTHPTVIHSFYARAGMEQATASGHLLDLFLAPVVETPKDENVNSDFAKGTAECGAAPDGTDEDVFDACCALQDAAHRVEVNLDYFTGAMAEARFTIGVNPTWLRQARECIAQPDAATRERGVVAMTTLAAFRDQVAFSRWTHTGLTDPDIANAAEWFVARTGKSFDGTVDTQAEYALLHAGIASVYDYHDLGTLTVDGVDLVMSDYELPIRMGAGNSFDGNVMVEDAWASPSWVTAIRDGNPDQPLDAFYFGSAGGIPEVGLYGYRKKELFPVPWSERAAAFDMGTDPETWYTGGGDSGMVYLGGMNWALNTVGDLAEAGVFRETLVWGNAVEERDWTAVRRYLRRTTASSRPDDVKTWYIHIFDISNLDGDFQDAAGVTGTSDINLDALAAIRADLVEPGWARWALPDEILAEYAAR